MMELLSRELLSMLAREPAARLHWVSGFYRHPGTSFAVGRVDVSINHALARELRFKERRGVSNTPHTREKPKRPNAHTRRRP
jgi:hypothetical protein